MLDLQKMQMIASQSYAVAALSSFGAPGTQALQELVSMIVRIFKNIDPALRAEPLALFVRATIANPFATTSSSPTPIGQISSAERVGHELDEGCIVEVLASGDLTVFAPDALDPLTLSQTAIVYTYHDGVERFIIKGESFTVINPAATHASVFARPTFSSLSEALEDYRTRVVRDTSCFILADAWHDKKRIFLRAKPEETMRRSLHQFLRSVFRDAEVRPEQVVDESHPVDIKITWSDTNQRALIEIKWLGQSRDEVALRTAYSAGRARDGAKQLADYLDADRTAGPGLRTRGYLVVFDARRRGLTLATTAVDASDGLFYRDDEIAYDPRYHDTRRDFELPVRMFAEPVLN